jgi:dextranase
VRDKILKSVIDDGLAWGDGKPVVLAAYMDRGKTSGNFGTPGVLLCDATIFASGGTHLELGDGGHMLDNEYFPNETLTLSPNLANTLTNLL